MEDDKELMAMSSIANALGDLDSEAQERVLRWAIDRFKINKLGESNRSSLINEAPLETYPASTKPPPSEQIGEVTFSDFATLFDHAYPETGPEKALVAGYWFQACQNMDTFEGAQVNTELKHLGHGLPNVTDSLSSLMHRRPALVLQVRKSGRSKQARKLYKLTQEGIRKVLRMIAAPSPDDEDDEY